jgi:hypothetical protein
MWQTWVGGFFFAIAVCILFQILSDFSLWGLFFFIVAIAAAVSLLGPLFF